MRQPSLFDAHSGCESGSPVVGHPSTSVTAGTGLASPHQITRRSHPETSLMAAADLIVSGNLSKHEDRAVELVKQFPGMTARNLMKSPACKTERSESVSAVWLIVVSFAAGSDGCVK